MALHTAVRSIFILPLMLGLAVSCQRSHPVAPDQDASTPVQEPAIAASARTQQAPLAAAHVRFQPSSGLLELTPIRSATAGSQDVLEHVDVTQFFVSAPCTDCLKVTGVGVSAAGNPLLGISVRHPFPSPAPGLQARQDLSVFNVEGVIRFAEAGETVTLFPEQGVSAVTSTRLVNADGYSGALDGAYDVDYSPTSANVHPYRLFFRDYTNGTYDGSDPQGFPDYTDIEGFLAMGQGKGPDVQSFEFAMSSPGQLVEFDLILQASFGVGSLNIAERAAPEYRLPQYNKKAASEVHVGLSDAVPGNLSGRGLLSQISTSAAQVRISVLDINDASTGVGVGTNRDQLRAASDVASLDIEIPGVLTSNISVGTPGTIFEGGVGDAPLTPLTFALGITNQTSAVSGTYFGMVRVGDSYPLDSNTILPEDTQRFSSPGFTTPFALAEIATYQMFPVVVKTNSVTRFDDSLAGDALGTCLATGDFNGDGLLDVVCGAFEADAGAISNSGQLFVYYALPNGFLPFPVILQEPTPQLNVRFGFAVACGDITGDGLDDIVASATNPNIAGRIQVFRSQGTSFLGGVTIQDALLPVGSRFGWSLATGDVNDDGRADVMIGAPEALGSFFREGVVYRYFGTASGLSSPFTISAPDPQLDTLFGSSVEVLRDASGEPTELAVGMPGHSGATGRVYVFPITGVGGFGTPIDVDPIAGNAEDAFGYSLAVADFTDDGLMDLVVGAPGSAISMNGRVEVLIQGAGPSFTTISTLTASGANTYTFGSAVATGDFDGDGAVDVAGGGLLLDASGISQGGRVAIFPGGRELSGNVLEFHAPSATIDQFFGRSLLGLPQAGVPDLLLVGAPADDPSGKTNAGSVYLY